MTRIFSAVLYMCLVSTSVLSQTSENIPKPLLVGDPAPVFSDVTWLRGGPVERWQAGHVYLLDFWATWCAPCLQMMPSHQALEDRHETERFHVVGIAIWSDDGPLTPTRALEKHQSLSYAVTEDVEDRIADMYMGGTGTRGLPTFMLVDREGRLARVHSVRGEIEEAIRWQQRAIDAAPEAQRDSLTKTLREFEKAANSAH